MVSEEAKALLKVIDTDDVNACAKFVGLVGRELEAAVREMQKQAGGATQRSLHRLHGDRVPGDRGERPALQMELKPRRLFR